MEIKEEGRREGEVKGKMKTQQIKLKNSFCIKRSGRDLRKEAGYQGLHIEIKSVHLALRASIGIQSHFNDTSIFFRHDICSSMTRKIRG